MKLDAVRLAADFVGGAHEYATVLGGAAKDVVSTTSVKLRFDRFLLPVTAIRQAICVQPVLTAVKSVRDCSQPVFFEPSYDPVRREITYRQSSNPERPHLLPGTTYRLTVLPFNEDDALGIAAFDGAPLDAITTVDFTTRAADPAGAKVEAIPADDLFCDPPPPTDVRNARSSLQNCSFGNGCHGPGVDENSVFRGPAMGLNLRETEDIIATALNHVAHQTAMGEHADEPDRNPARFGRAMPLIDPGNPGNSYLLYKALANPINPSDPETAPTDDEVARLRASVVVGMPMPPSNLSGAALGQEGLDTLSAWILQGAPTPVCPE